MGTPTLPQDDIVAAHVWQAAVGQAACRASSRFLNCSQILFHGIIYGGKDPC